VAGRKWTEEPCRIGDVVGSFVETLAPVHARCDSVSEALASLLPPTMRDHCRLDGVSGGSLKLVVDGASYLYELQLCKAELLLELQQLCPGAGLRRIQITTASRRR
jgi:hypothetical protein